MEFSLLAGETRQTHEAYDTIPPLFYGRRTEVFQAPRAYRHAEAARPRRPGNAEGVSRQKRFAVYSRQRPARLGRKHLLSSSLQGEQGSGRCAIAEEC